MLSFFLQFLYLFTEFAREFETTWAIIPKQLYASGSVNIIVE